MTVITIALIIWSLIGFFTYAIMLDAGKFTWKGLWACGPLAIVLHFAALTSGFIAQVIFAIIFAIRNLFKNK